MAVSSAVSAPSPLLRVHDLHVSLAGSHILQGVSFDVAGGQTTVLLGRNGAGKSTTLRAIMGIVSVKSGEVALAGEGVAGLPSHQIARRGVGFVPEDREIFSAVTVEENLRLALRGNAALPDGIDRVYGLFPDLRSAAGRSGGALSGGQQQMLSIGRALVNRNRVILVDEPTKGLAPIIVRQLQDIFRSLKEQGETILLVEQNLEFARAVGDRYFILDEGRIVAGGPIEDLTRNPENLRRYIGV